MRACRTTAISRFGSQGLQTHGVSSSTSPIVATVVTHRHDPGGFRHVPLLGLRFFAHVTSGKSLLSSEAVQPAHRDVSCSSLNSCRFFKACSSQHSSLIDDAWRASCSATEFVLPTAEKFKLGRLPACHTKDYVSHGRSLVAEASASFIRKQHCGDGACTMAVCRCGFSD